MQALPLGQDDGDSNREPGSDGRLALRERAEEEVDNERDFGRQPGVLFLGADVADDGGEADEPERYGRSGRAADAPADPARQPDERESPHARGGARVALALAPFALDTQERPDPQRHTKRKRRLSHN